MMNPAHSWGQAGPLGLLVGGLKCVCVCHSLAFELPSYTSVSTRSRSILRTLPSTATRLVMQ